MDRAHKNHPQIDPNLIKCSSLHLDEDSTQLANDCSHVHAKPSLTAKLIHQRTGRIITSQQVNSIRSKQKQLEDLTDTLDASQTSAEKLLECLNSAERISYMALFHDPTSSLLTDSNAPCPKPKKKKGKSSFWISMSRFAGKDKVAVSLPEEFCTESNV